MRLLDDKFVRHESPDGVYSDVNPYYNHDYHAYFGLSVIFFIDLQA